MGKSPYGYDYSIFRGTLNHIISKAIFQEFKTSNEKVGIEPIFTMREHDWDGCLSIRRLYLDIADPTEYEFATTVFGSIDVWERIKNSSWFQDTYELMKRDLEMKIAAVGFRELEAKAERSVDAAKFLANKGWTKETKKRGRPPKSPNGTNTGNNDSHHQRQVDDDYERLMGKNEPTTH